MERESFGRLDDFELKVYLLYSELHEANKEHVPGNRQMAEILKERSGLDTSRIAVAKARRRIAHKMGFKMGW